MPVGSYSVTATATDNTGLTSTTPVLSLTVQVPTVQPYYVFTDPLGTPRLVTDAKSNVVWSRTALSEPYGAQAPDTIPGSSFVMNIREGNCYADQETGLDYCWNRYRDKQTGGWKTADPIGLAGGQASLYAYANGNPVMAVDPTGLDVSFDGSPDFNDLLKKAYRDVRKTKRGKELCDKFENSDAIYRVKYISDSNNPLCEKLGVCTDNVGHVIYIDPYRNYTATTSQGEQNSPLPIVLGHEMGHLDGTRDSGPGGMDNVNKNENPIRQDMGLPPRTMY